MPMCAATLIYIWFVGQVSQDLHFRFKVPEASGSSKPDSDENKSGVGFLTVLRFEKRVVTN